MYRVCIIGDIAYENFQVIEDRLRANGYIPINPQRQSGENRLDTFNYILECDAVLFVGKYDKKDLNMAVICDKPILSKMNYDVL